MDKELCNEYLIVYAYGENNCSFGNLRASFNSYPPTFSDIQNTEKIIREKKGYDKVTIVNWLPLSNAERNGNG